MVCLWKEVRVSAGLKGWWVDLVDWQIQSLDLVLRYLNLVVKKTSNQDERIPHICHFFYTGKIFGEENLHQNLHSKLLVYTVNCQFTR